MMITYLDLVPDGPNVYRLNSVIESAIPDVTAVGDALLLDANTQTIPGALPVSDWEGVAESGLAELIQYGNGQWDIRSDITYREEDLGPEDGVAYIYRIGDGPEKFATGKVRAYFRSLPD